MQESHNTTKSTVHIVLKCTVGKGLNSRETVFLIANMLELNLLSSFWSVHRVVGWQHYAQDRVVFQKDGIKIHCIVTKKAGQRNSPRLILEF